MPSTGSSPHPPIAVLIAGANGAGKSTAASRLLNGALGVIEFINADLIAQGLSPFDPDGAALAARDVMIQRMEALFAAGISFGLETTLAARTLAPRLKKPIAAGSQFQLVFLFLPSADLAVARVANRVLLGGHHIPVETIRRRYRAGLENFFELYQPIATNWQVFDNSQAGAMKLIAAGSQHGKLRVVQKTLWKQIEKDDRP
ncbi:MAG: zeta toxin [Planctomycetaceae bacterium]|nr:zeta toxin [Planctomycetaceae bacterium]